MPELKRITMQDVMDVTVAILEQQDPEALEREYWARFFGPFRVPLRYEVRPMTQEKTQQ
jgi:hypothetical protein